MSIKTLIPPYIKMLDFHWVKAMLFFRKYYDFLQFFLHHGIFFPPFLVLWYFSEIQRQV
jgi:hypothetical protein